MLFFGGEQILGKKDGKLNSGFKWDNFTLEKTLSLRLCWENYLCHHVSHPGAADWSPDSMDSALLRAIIRFTTATSVSLDEETGLLTLPTKEEAGNSRVW